MLALEAKYSSIEKALEKSFIDNSSYLGDSGARFLLGSLARRDVVDGKVNIKAVRLVLTKLDLLERAVELSMIKLGKEQSPSARALLSYESLSNRLMYVCEEYGVQSYEVEVVNALNKRLKEEVMRPLLKFLGG